VDGSALRRAADRIARISAEPRDVVALWQETTEVLATAVPFYLDAVLVHRRPGVTADHQPLPRVCPSSRGSG
jgi:hypothetical protein